MNSLTLPELLQVFPNSGELVWIGIRPAKKEPMIAVSQLYADVQSGLCGDRYQGSSGRRQVTLIQWEHLQVLASITGKTVTPELLRRNLVIKGLNLLALKNRIFCIGEARLQMTGLCHPCSRMEVVLGPGGYNAMRGHGGITAQIIGSGLLQLGDPVTVADPVPSG